MKNCNCVTEPIIRGGRIITPEERGEGGQIAFKGVIDAINAAGALIPKQDIVYDGRLSANEIKGNDIIYSKNIVSSNGLYTPELFLGKLTINPDGFGGSTNRGANHISNTELVISPSIVATPNGAYIPLLTITGSSFNHLGSLISTAASGGNPPLVEINGTLKVYHTVFDINGIAKSSNDYFENTTTYDQIRAAALFTKSIGPEGSIKHNRYDWLEATGRALKKIMEIACRNLLISQQVYNGSGKIVKIVVSAGDLYNDPSRLDGIEESDGQYYYEIKNFETATIPSLDGYKFEVLDKDGKSLHIYPNSDGLGANIL